MPKLELGDLEGVAKAKRTNIPLLKQLIDDGWDIVAPIPSCVLMFKQELALMFPDDGLKQRGNCYCTFSVVRAKAKIKCKLIMLFYIK